MSTRKVKEAKDLETNELIYFKGHAKATYMSDGRTVEDAIEETSGGGDIPSKNSQLENDMNYVSAESAENTEMLDRSVKDASLNKEKIYFKSHARATYMDDGTTVEAALAKISVKQAVDLSMFDVNGNAINQSTANCYVVKEAGEYKIPLVFGNAIKNGNVNSAAYTNNGEEYATDFVDYNDNVITSPYIEDVSGFAAFASLTNFDTKGVFSEVSIVLGSQCRYLQFKVDNVPQSGANGVISIKDVSGVVMWSWHIWVWPYEITTIEVTNYVGVKYNFMSVNLASIYDADGVNTRNWLYQWGRKDPMLCGETFNSAADNPVGVIQYAEKTSKLSNGIRNNTTFYYDENGVVGMSGYTATRWYGSDRMMSNNLWNAGKMDDERDDDTIVIKTIYDPCPAGWKVPNSGAFSGLTDAIGEGDPLTDNKAYFSRYEGDTVGMEVQNVTVIDGYTHERSNTVTTYATAKAMLYMGALIRPISFMYGVIYGGEMAEGDSIRPITDDLENIDVV